MSGNKIVRKLKNEIRNDTISDSDEEIEEKPKKAMEDADIEFVRVRRKRRSGRRRSKSRRRRSKSRRRRSRSRRRRYPNVRQEFMFLNKFQVNFSLFICIVDNCRICCSFCLRCT